ncbi:MAG: histidine kinase [Gammaproteobacteria bacterium]|nr:histidine kinase [Gammaproteobacteria bacterium]
MVILEVTESQEMSNILGCVEKMMHLRMKRFGLSLDDFGTGHSSMEQLKRIPFTELKIDRAFVHGAVTKSSAKAILESSVDLGKRLKMDIVAEGAETKEECDLVKQLGCDYVQGFYYAKPMPGNELIKCIDDWPWSH